MIISDNLWLFHESRRIFRNLAVEKNGQSIQFYVLKLNTLNRYDSFMKFMWSSGSDFELFDRLNFYQHFRMFNYIFLNSFIYGIQIEMKFCS